MSEQILQNRLDQLTDQGLIRTLAQPQGVDLSSNDYLGFATDPILQQRFLNRLNTIPQGATGSRLLRGNLALYEETEALLAAFVHREAAVLFSSGYSANVGLLSSLLRANDVVFSDALNHASIIDGIRLSKAQRVIFPHRDYDYLAGKLQEYNNYPGLKLVVTESVFSMEGTIADLHLLAELASQHNALLIVDEAHSTGIWGSNLLQTLELTDQVFASVHPAGKALGASGAWVAGSQVLKNYLLQFARSFLFSTAPLPALAVLLQEAVKFYSEVGEERGAIVRERALWLRKQLCAYKVSVGESPIISILIGNNTVAVEVGRQLQQRGWDVRAIRPPTVPVGTARLRITVKWGNTQEQLACLVQDLQEIIPRPDKYL
jgi:8-amino-7-oxononanoate synthase